MSDHQQRSTTLEMRTSSFSGSYLDLNEDGQPEPEAAKGPAKKKQRGKAAKSHPAPEGSMADLLSVHMEGLQSLVTNANQESQAMKTENNALTAKNALLKKMLDDATEEVQRANEYAHTRSLLTETTHYAILYMQRHTHSFIFPSNGANFYMDVASCVQKFVESMTRGGIVSQINAQLAKAGNHAIVKLGSVTVDGEPYQIEIHMRVNDTPKMIARKNAKEAVELLTTCVHGCIFCSKRTTQIKIEEGDVVTDLVVIRNKEDTVRGNISLTTMAPTLLIRLRSLIMTMNKDPMTPASSPDLLSLLTARFNRGNPLPSVLTRPPWKSVIAFKLCMSDKLKWKLNSDPSIILPDFFHGSKAEIGDFVKPNGSLLVDYRRFNTGVYGNGMYYASNGWYSHCGYAKKVHVCPKCGHTVQDSGRITAHGSGVEWSRCTRCANPPETVECKELLYVTVDTTNSGNIQRTNETHSTPVEWTENDVFQTHRQELGQQENCEPYNKSEGMRFFEASNGAKRTTGFVQTRISDDVMVVGIMYVEV